MRPLLHPDHLRSFALVCELGSFSAAADRLGLSQPAVSQQVRQLEQRYGLRLLERVGRRARPTAAGEELLRHARSVAAALAATEAGMARHGTEVIGQVRLGSGATACIYLLPAVLRELRRRLPGLEIVVRTCHAAEAVRAVEDNSLDLALVTLPASGRMLEVIPVVDDPFVAIGPADGEPLPPEVSPADLAGRPLVLFSPSGNTRSLVDAWLARGGVAAHPVMELDSVEAIKELVGAGLGYSVLPSMALPPGRRGAAIAVRGLAPPLGRTLAVVLRRDKPLQAGLRATVEALSALAPASRRDA
ncbi:LysR family transcriptional regulator [Cupriavidus sp. USMAA2-4]|uniref:LysR family transcriptional regulator n=1 Tax=Cupriavidus malaysiensis TaxID=367825 RepID=A0ABN4TGV1_9BURK|nr:MULTISPECIES: LysR family transcriptional regulator [Cupriavidus]AOY92400.1 LysR family transcriptional regulator [Cupriavidus sp. USMAA2-4]AOY98017.1 LysR family transcriptional regulator [Cupriavidus sp. USMAHM13]AOZ04445.1 LysR family transcriptional regulator [Cupriavidus malaysiensis]